MRNLIMGMARPVLGLIGRDDRGAVGTLIAILVGGGVLLGMGALVVDAGQLYAQRAQLQNGADAGALAVAKSCAQGTCAPAVAGSYANANSATGTAAVNLVCGSGTLGGCPASSGLITDCPAAPPAGTGYVDVHTSTLMPGGSTLLPPSFARTLLGDNGYRGSTVLACAQAEWGAPATADTIAFTISACEWDKATSVGTSFAPPPPYPPNPLPAQSFDQVLKLHTTTSGSCPSEPAGADGPGAFGWTDDQTGTCTVDIINNTFSANTGVSAGQTCKQALQTAWANKTVVYLPIYVALTGSGTGATYSLKGFAAFVITGYHLSGFSQSDWLKPANDCKGSDKCINGYFTHGLLPQPGSIGGPNLGAEIIRLSG